MRGDDDILGGQGQSYLSLYPPGDVYQVQVVGDWMADGLRYGLTEAFRGDARVQVRPKQLDFPSLMRGDFEYETKELDEDLGKGAPQVAVVMLGPQDRTSLRIGSRRFGIDTDEWRAEFGRQIDVVMKVLRRRKIAVYWVSLPNVRRTDTNEDVLMLNEIIREKVILNGFKYIDAYAGFTDDGGSYSAMGPDLTGKIRLLREQNGVSFTEAGNRKLAHFVERELKRDLTQAKRDRTIPLAGTEAEQASIAAQRQTQQRLPRPVAGTPLLANGQPQLGPPAPGQPAGTTASAAANGDQKADSGRISIALTAPGGKEEIVAIDLLRPAIPASILELVNKKEVADKPTTLGDLLVDKIPGGVIVMSSISPAAEAGGRNARLQPTQTPYFRVMVKGERMPVRADRSDDVAWPRPEPPPVEIEAPKAAPPVAAPSAAPEPARKQVSKPKRAEVDGVRVR
ncbi:MAG: DUF459 domain-containing protein [Verrucomicrobiae bacterium]|nr:DUF459 domain-containing protein [Verrucomicrobiae bacterium]